MLLTYVSSCSGDSVALCIRRSAICFLLHRWFCCTMYSYFLGCSICMIIVCAWSYHSSMISVYARIVLPKYYPYVSYCSGDSVALCIRMTAFTSCLWKGAWSLYVHLLFKLFYVTYCSGDAVAFMLHIAQVMLLHLCYIVLRWCCCIYVTYCSGDSVAFMLHIAQVMLLHLCIRIIAFISWLKATRLS
jgi:hypothetical protein